MSTGAHKPDVAVQMPVRNQDQVVSPNSRWPLLLSPGRSERAGERLLALTMALAIEGALLHGSTSL